MIDRSHLLRALGGPTQATPTQRPQVLQFMAGAAGRKVYGGGRAAPNMGATPNMAGYRLRDAIAQRKKGL